MDIQIRTRHRCNESSVGLANLTASKNIPYIKIERQRRNFKKKTWPVERWVNRKITCQRQKLNSVANAEIFRKHSKVNGILVTSISKRPKLFLFIIYIQIVIMTNIGGSFLGLLVKGTFFVNKCFLMDITHFTHFQYFHFEINFLKNENLFQKTGVP